MKDRRGPSDGGSGVPSRTKHTQGVRGPGHLVTERVFDRSGEPSPEGDWTEGWTVGDTRTTTFVGVHRVSPGVSGDCVCARVWTSVCGRPRVNTYVWTSVHVWIPVYERPSVGGRPCVDTRVWTPVWTSVHVWLPCVDLHPWVDVRGWVSTYIGGYRWETCRGNGPTGDV